jgi:hypothetical protein
MNSSNANAFTQDFGLILVGSIIFTASFMWKDLLTDIQEIYFPKQDFMIARILFTIAITSLLVIIAVNLRNYFGLNSLPSSESVIVFDDSPQGNGDNQNFATIR